MKNYLVIIRIFTKMRVKRFCDNLIKQAELEKSFIRKVKYSDLILGTKRFKISESDLLGKYSCKENEDNMLEVTSHFLIKAKSTVEVFDFIQSYPLQKSLSYKVEMHSLLSMKGSNELAPSYSLEIQ